LEASLRGEVATPNMMMLMGIGNELERRIFKLEEKS
jgi:hypothetical protein